jgi:hypothetical protein
VTVEGQVDRLEADPPQRVLADQLGQAPGQAGLHAVFDHLVVRALVFGLLAGAAVGQQVELLARDEQVAGRIARRQIVAAVAAQVVARLGLGDEQRVEVERGELLAQPLNAPLNR